MWVAEQKLVKNGNSISVTIPRGFLHQLGWLAGRRVIVELNDDSTMCVVRLPQPSDYGPVGPPSIHRVMETPKP